MRFPEAAGAAAYVKEAFGSDALSRLTGLAVAAVVIVSTASIARGSAGHIQSFAHLSDAVIAGGLLALFTAIACLRVRESIGLAAVMTLIEIEPSQGNADASIRDGVAPVYNYKCAWPAPSEVQADFRDCIRSLLPERLRRPPRDHASMVRTRRISSVLRPIAWGRRTPGSATTS